MDVARMAAALSRAGIDPRDWTTLAVVRAVKVTSSGVMLDVTTLTGIEESAALAPPYGGPGYGAHFPVEVGSMVVIAIPEGDYGTGARVVGVVWDKADPPPQAAVNNPEDVVIVVKPDRSFRLGVSGDGIARLGDVDADDAAAMRSTLLDFRAALAAAIAALSGSGDPSVSALSALQDKLDNIPPGLTLPPEDALLVHIGKKFPVCAEKVRIK